LVKNGALYVVPIFLEWHTLQKFPGSANVDKKRKRVDEIASSSSAAAGKAPVLAEDMEYFDLLAS
jgi:hypothetical protein